jgi:hypothetical protein
MANPQFVTLVANTASSVTLDWPSHLIEVVNVSGTAAVYFTLDGSLPAVATDGSMVLPAAIGALEVGPTSGGVINKVRLISAGTPLVSVRVIA